MNKKIGMVAILFLLFSPFAMAQDEDLTPPKQFIFGIEEIINGIPVIGTILVPDETVISDAQKINIDSEEKLIQLQEQADSGAVSQEELKASSDLIESGIENNNMIIQENINDIQSANPNEDVSDAQIAVAEASSIEPTVTSQDISDASGGEISKDTFSNNDLGVVESGVEGGTIQSDSGVISSSESGVAVTGDSGGESSGGSSEGVSSSGGGDSGSSGSSGDGGSGGASGDGGGSSSSGGGGGGGE